MPDWSPYNYAFNNPMRFIILDVRAPFDWFKNKEGRIVSFDNKSKSFSDSNNNTWTNIGITKQDVMKHLNVPTNTEFIKCNTISTFLFDDEDSSGNQFSLIGSVVFNNTAKVYYNLDIKATKQPFEQPVSGKSEVTGIDVNVMLTSEHGLQVLQFKT